MCITTRDNKVYQSESGMLAGEILVEPMSGQVFYRHSNPCNGLTSVELEDIATLLRAREIVERSQPVPAGGNDGE